jgi:hypothetical protein
MCTVSMVIDAWRQPQNPNYIPMPPPPEVAQMMLDIIRRLEALDEKVNAIDCKLKEDEKREFKAALQEVADTNGPFTINPDVIPPGIPPPGLFPTRKAAMEWLEWARKQS